MDDIHSEQHLEKKIDLLNAEAKAKMAKKDKKGKSKGSIEWLRGITSSAKYSNTMYYTTFWILSPWQHDDDDDDFDDVCACACALQVHYLHSNDESSTKPN